MTEQQQRLQNTRTFRVTRTSQSSYEDTKPCEGAYKGTYIALDRRTFATEEEHDGKHFNANQPWRSIGYNHSTWDNHGKPGIQRLREHEGWLIDLTPDGLMEFAERHGEIVLIHEGHGSTPELEIYDDYRE